MRRQSSVPQFLRSILSSSTLVGFEKEDPSFNSHLFDESFHEAWDRYKDLLRACPHHGFTKLHQLNTFYNALNPADQDSLNFAAGGNLLERSTQDVLTILEKQMTICLAAEGNTFLEYHDNIQDTLQQATYGTYVPMPQPFINPEEDERVDETLTDPEHVHLVGKFTFPADFVIVDYESDPRVPLILGRPFLRTARALIDVHGEEMILRDGDERLILNMRHDTSSYSNKPKKESINMIDIYNVSHEDYLEDLFANEKITNHLSGNPTPISDPIVSSSPTLTSLEESDLIWEEFEAYLASDSFPPGSDDTDFDPEGDLRLIEELLNNDPSSPLPLSHNPLSGSTTSSSPDHLLEEFADELALITFPPGNDDLPFDIESDLREIEYLLNHDPTKEMDSILEDSVDEGNLADPNNDLVDTIPEMFTDEHTLDYSSPPLYDDVDDDLVELESDNDDVYDDPFDSKEDKIKVSKLLIDELDPPRSSDFLPSPKCDSVLYENFSEVDALPSTNNEDKVFNPGILIHENLFEVTIRVTNYEKNVKKTTNASLILKDFNPPLYELPFHKEVPGSETLLSFSSENEEKFSNLGFSLLKELIFLFSRNHLIEALNLSKIAPDFEASRARGFVLRSLELQILRFIMGIQYPNLID
ncbi:reverse transcriptase domain-containing protein [Tanacetum coccineum]